MAESVPIRVPLAARELLRLKAEAASFPLGRAAGLAIAAWAPAGGGSEAVDELERRVARLEEMAGL